MIHLIHPALVHLTVTFLVVGGIGEGIGILAGRKAWERGCGRLVLAGTVSLLPTVVAGFLAQNVVAVPAGGAADLASHERAGLVLLGLASVLALWKGWYRGEIPGDQKTLYATLVLACAALAVFTAWLGGELVYGHGIGVAAG